MQMSLQYELNIASYFASIAAYYLIGLGFCSSSQGKNDIRSQAVFLTPQTIRYP
ncbi:MAG: hypothetical protein K2P61_10895 [Burkholderiaceae bacterium]|nr:hypothetical protein [Burkholderiaceae bacterium]